VCDPPVISPSAVRTRALSRAPTSVDVELRKFPGILTSEAPVRTWIPDPSGKLDDTGFVEYIEVDEVLTTDGVDLSPAAGMPLVTDSTG
jgi:hypothetical protein